MAWVKSFVITKEKGFPDAYIRAFLNECEKEGPIRVQTSVAQTGTAQLLNVIVTKIDNWDETEFKK